MYLRQYFPNAELVKTASTAAAAEVVAHGDGTSLAVGCRVCADLYPKLEVLAEGIQQDSGAFITHFIVPSLTSKR